MAFIVTDNCNGCRFTDCVAVCPVEAIYDETQVPDDKKEWIKANADKAPSLPVVNKKVDPLPGAEAKKESLGF